MAHALAAWVTTSDHLIKLAGGGGLEEILRTTSCAIARRRAEEKREDTRAQKPMINTRIRAVLTARKKAQRNKPIVS